MAFGIHGCDLRSLRLAIAGFALHWTWIWCVFWSSLFYNAVPEGLSAATPLLASTRLEPLWTLSLGANVCTMAALLALVHRRAPLAAVRALPWLGAVLTSAGTLLVGQPVLKLLVGGTVAAYVVGMALTGVGSSIVVVLWAELLGHLGARRTVGVSSASLILAAAIYMMLTLLPTGLAQCATALLPLAGVALQRRCAHTLVPLPKRARALRVTERPPVRMIVIALFFGLSFGAMKGLMTPVTPELISLRDALNIVAIIVGALAVYATTNICRMDFDHLTYQVALPLMAAGFLFLPLHGVVGVVGTAVHQCGYQYFYIVLWATWPVLAARCKASVGWVAAWGMLAIQLGQFIGSCTAALGTSLIASDLGLAMLSAVVVFVMLLVALFVFGNRTAQTGWGSVRPAEDEAPASALEQAAGNLALRVQLSPREQDVLMLLARGRNRAYIAAELSIGDETVKSHVKNLYRKLGVHSQQELIDLVEQEKDMGR